MSLSDTGSRPTLLSSCALATTTAESRFRIDRPITPSRAACVIALDDGAAVLLRHVAELPWGAARFFRAEAVADGGLDVALSGLDGARTALLSTELDSADMTLVLATTGQGGETASVVGRSCAARGLTTAGIVLSDGSTDAGAAVSALRPHARVLLVSSDEHDVIDVLAALRV
jgi:hypothetical protein